MGLLSKIQDVLSGEHKPGKAGRLLKVDLHSHLIPGIDDGSADMEDSVRMIREISDMGVEKIITTPHISEIYPNTPEIISSGLQQVREALGREKINVQIEAAAEYYLDDAFVSMVKNKAPLLTFGDNYVLVETNYIQQDPRLKEVFFELKLQGYHPVFAHPERYLYLNHGPKYPQLVDLFNYEIHFQMNLLSLTGYYGAQIKALADFMLKNRMVHFVGSDIHRFEQAQAINRFKDTKGFEKLSEVELLNNGL